PATRVVKLGEKGALVFQISKIKDTTPMLSADLSGVLGLYGEAVPERFFEKLEKDLCLSARQRIFSLPVVARLTISQRLDGKATLSTAVHR
ncbi:MAG: hypothetical protein M3Z36_10345, partial [Acidobacteriota bacterium]|nr:hypothetical protein [Acidobacteriota bacterium]